MSATQNIYSNVWAFQRGNETTALANLDEFCYPTCGPNTAPRFFQRQFSSLYAWSNTGGSSYNAGQLILRHAALYPAGFVTWARRVMKWSTAGQIDSRARWLAAFAQYAWLVAHMEPRMLPKTLLRPLFILLSARQQGWARRIARRLQLTQAS